ncbi:MAG: hypothetical protein IAE94_09550 [Chthoniobacterales bacterium]|nr:hypothetical protein [Chthoniobacterales bacterium]
MKQKPQIGYRSDKEGKPVWTMDSKPVPFALARKHWVEATADWSMSAYQAMAVIVLNGNKADV